MHHPHFLRSAAARTLSMRAVFAMSDDQAFEALREVRWGRDGEPVCPACGVVERHWFLSSRRQWRCQDCGHTFSVTSGTIFAHHKLPLQIHLGAIALYSHAVKGLSALQLSRDLDVQYKTAFVVMHKLRQSLMDQRDETPLAGEVELDGGYVGGSVRPANRADRRLGELRTPTSAVSW
jgi:transposase-like protein